MSFFGSITEEPFGARISGKNRIFPHNCRLRQSIAKGNLVMKRLQSRLDGENMRLGEVKHNGTKIEIHWSETFSRLGLEVTIGERTSSPH